MRTLATLRRPRSVQVLPNGKLLVSDEDTLVVLSAKDGKRGKQPKLLPFSAPEGIAISATAVYVTDSHQHQLHRLHLDDLTPNGAVGSPGSVRSYCAECMYVDTVLCTLESLIGYLSVMNMTIRTYICMTSVIAIWTSRKVHRLKYHRNEIEISPNI